MRRVILLIAALATQATLNAQTQKGSWMINPGLLDAKHTKFDFEPGYTNSVNITPGVGYFVAKNFALGMSMGLGVSNGPSFHISTIPFARYYMPVKDIQTKKLRFFGQVSGGANFYFYKYGGSGYLTDKIYSLGAQVGMTYFILPNASIEGALATNQYFFNTENQSATGFQFSFNYFLFRSTKSEPATGDVAQQQPVTVSTKAGTVLLGSGTASIDNIHSSVNGNQGTQISFYQKTGVFVANNLAVGATLGYKWYSQVSSNEGTAVPFIRYYLPVKQNEKQHNLRFFAELGGGIGRGGYANGYPDNSRTHYHYSIVNGTIGANYFLTPHVNLETGFIYERQSYSGFNRNTTGISAGLNVFLFKNK